MNVDAVMWYLLVGEFFVLVFLLLDAVKSKYALVRWMGLPLASIFCIILVVFWLPIICFLIAESLMEHGLQRNT